MLCCYLDLNRDPSTTRLASLYVKPILSSTWTISHFLGDFLGTSGPYRRRLACHHVPERISVRKDIFDSKATPKAFARDCQEPEAAGLGLVSLRIKNPIGNRIRPATRSIRASSAMKSNNPK